MIIAFQNRQSSLPVRPLYPVIRSALTHLNDLLAADPAYAGQQSLWQAKRESVLQLTVLLTGPRLMRHINQQTRGVDRTTDVLSFPLLALRDGQLLQPLGPQDFEPGRPRRLPLGDLLICPNRARTQADRYGHSFEEELAFLAGHGFLHLLGFDHEQADREAAMRQLQARMKAAMGFKPHDPLPKGDA